MIEHHPRNKAEVQTLLEKALLHMTNSTLDALSISTRRYVLFLY